MTDATRVAILNANYIKARLEAHYDVLYANHNGRVAHEMIFDLRPFKHGAGASVDEQDVAKRLMDYGFHAPTVSFPVPGTMMIEPTESEPKGELDRFCDALVAIRKEIQAVLDGQADAKDNVLKNAPHTADARHGGCVDASLLARAGRLSVAVGAREQGVAVGLAHRQPVRGPQPDLRVSADRGLRLRLRRETTAVVASLRNRAGALATDALRCSSFFVTGPALPDPTARPSTLTTGLSSRVVDVMNISSALSRSFGSRVSSRTSIPSSRPSSKMNARVTPSSRPAADSGVSAAPPRTMKKLACEHSVSSPR